MPFELKLEPHPARTLCPISGEQTELLPHTKSVRVNGRLVAYIQIDKPGRPLTFIGTFPPEFAAQIKEQLEAVLGHEVGSVGIPPKSMLAITEDEDDSED